MNPLDRNAESRNVAQAGDDWIDSLLARDAAASPPYVDDAGFTTGVMAKLPAMTARSRYGWIVPAMGVLGFAIGIGALSGGEVLSLTVARLATFESFSLQSLLVAAIPLGILYGFGVSTALRER